MIAEIQCLPNPPGTPEVRYKHIEAAIAEIEASGLKYEVGALGTTIEGEPDAVWPLLRRVHEACLAAGALSTISIVKLSQAGESVTPATIDSLTGRYRR